MDGSSRWRNDRKEGRRVGWMQYGCDISSLYTDRKRCIDVQKNGRRCDVLGVEPPWNHIAKAQTRTCRSRGVFELNSSHGFWYPVVPLYAWSLPKHFWIVSFFIYSNSIQFQHVLMSLLFLVIHHRLSRSLHQVAAFWFQMQRQRPLKIHKPPAAPKPATLEWHQWHQSQGTEGSKRKNSDCTSWKNTWTQWCPHFPSGFELCFECSCWNRHHCWCYSLSSREEETQEEPILEGCSRRWAANGESTHAIHFINVIGTIYAHANVGTTDYGNASHHERPHGSTAAHPVLPTSAIWTVLTTDTTVPAIRTTVWAGLIFPALHCISPLEDAHIYGRKKFGHWQSALQQSAPTDVSRDPVPIQSCANTIR